MQQKSQAEPVNIQKCMKVPANTSIKMSCKANLGKLDQRMPITFSEDRGCLPEGISIPDSAVLVKSGAVNKINVLVVMKHHIICS